MSKTFQFGNGEWAVGKETALAYNDENSNFKPLPFTFDRASTATVVNKDGLIETVGVDEPRIDFLNNTKGHLLLEPQRRNYVLYSETEGIIRGSNGWSGDTDNTITQNYGTTPFSGSKLKSTRIQFTGSSKEFRNNFATSTITPTASIYIKGTSGETIKFGSNLNEAIFTLNGDWQRLTQTAGSLPINRLTINTYSGATARDIEIYAPQIEDGSYATSYIPTQGSTVTRSAESCYNKPPDGIIGQTELTLFYQGIVEYSSSQDGHAITLSQGLDGSGSERMLLYRQSNGSIYFYIIDTSTQFSTPLLVNSNPQYNDKYAIAIKENDLVIYCNGVKVAENNSGTLSSTQYIYINEWSNQLNHQNKVLDVKLYNTALTDAELIALTS